MSTKSRESTRTERAAAVRQEQAAHERNRKLLVAAVVVDEDFLCPCCREFESPSRSALHAAADTGTVQVDYGPFHLLQDHYSTRALSAWAKQAGVTDSAVLAQVQKSDPRFVDAADAAAKKAGVSGTPTVFVNGKELQGTSVSDTVSRLEKMISQA